MRNLALEAPRLEMIDFVKRSIKQMYGFWGDAENEKSGPRGVSARSERFNKEKH